MKILESNKVLQSVFSGMAINYLNTEYQNGYIRDIYNECKVVMNSSNSITVSTGMIVVEGIRLLFDEAETFNITSFPDSSLLHHLVLKVTATTEGENTAEIINRINEPLRQDEILKTGSGVYELELASYLLSPNGISNFAQTLLPIILTNEELQSFKEMIDELDKKVDALAQVIITANEDAERALTTVSNFTVGTVQKGTDPAASIEVDVIKKTAKLNLTLPQGPKGDNGTVITIDGEPQDYFDGNVINDITKESANLFDGVYDLIGQYINPSTGQYATASGYKASSKLYPINSKKIYFKISEASRNMVLLFFDLSGNYLNEYVSLNNQSSYVYEIQGNASYFRTYTAEENNANIMISATDLPYHPYNPNRHITNPQAEFLKEKHNAASNLLNILKNNIQKTDVGVTINYTHSTEEFSVKGKVTNDANVILLSGFNLILEPGTYTLAMVDYVNKNTDRLLLFLGNGGWGVEFTINNYGNEPEYVTVTLNEKTTLNTLRFWTQETLGELDYSFKLMLVKGKYVPATHYKYNQKEHITNEQAELLKDIFEKQFNLLNENKYLGQYGTYANGKWTTKAADGYNCSIFTNEVGQSYDRDITKLPFLKAGTYTVIMYNVENNTSADDIIFAQINANGKYVAQLEVFDMDNLINGCVIDHFTVTEDFYLDIRQEANSGTLSFTGIAIYEGALTQVIPHYEYNSSSHITNSHADFLKIAYNKQLNIININGVKTAPSGMNVTAINNHVSIKGTGTVNGGIEFNEIVKLKPNTQYRLKVFNQKGTMNDPLYFWDYKNAKSYGGLDLNLLNSNALITTPSDISDEVRLNIYYDTSQGNIDIEFDVMLVEGTIVPEYFQNYQGGEYVQKGQIKNITFDESTGTLSITDN